MKLTNYILLIATSIFIGFSIFSSTIINLASDWLWFTEVGYNEIFIKSLSAKLIIGVSVGLFTAVFLASNLLFACRTKIPWIGSLPPSLTGQTISIGNQIVKKISIVLSLILALFIGSIASIIWQDVLKFISAEPFGRSDPVLGMDIGFYIFSLPVYSFFLGLAKFITIIALGGSLLIYILRGKINLQPLINLFNKPSKAGYNLPKVFDIATRIHISILIFILLIGSALDTKLSIYYTLFNQNNSVAGAAYTDATFMIPLLNITFYIYLLAGFMILFYAISNRIGPFLGAISLTVILGISGMVIPSMIQRFIVAPNELAKETPYIKHSIKATREAYKLADVNEKEISSDKTLTAEDISANNLTIKNIRLWDRDPLLSTFSQIQEIRTYYDFASVDNDRYIINNEIRQIMLSPRELSSGSLPNRNWINEHLTFTHGFGVAASPVNQVTPEGLPVLFVKDLPPKSSVPELTIDRPEIYYGELSNEYVIVKTNSKEFDYPKGEENVFTRYAGSGGVQIDSPLKRMLYAIRFGSTKIALSGDITNESRIMYHREIKERVAKIAPFFTYDNDPYLVISEGKLYWIFDAYTSSSLYPYSQPLTLEGKNINYIRNSAKIALDAYNGSVKIYISDPDDPIIKTYAKIFPKSFLPLSKMPENLVAHLRYPEDIFSLQTAIYTTYHMNNPQIFYNKEDQWEIPSILSDKEQNLQTSSATITGADGSIAPRHMIMKLPGEQKEEYILMLPFTPRAKDNLAAWMVARNDGKEYGKLAVYKFPKDQLIFGPRQVISRINQDAKVSQQISLWDQGGSQVIQGPLLVIPIENSLVYVRPLYLKAESGKIPELKRVIVAYANQIAMEETLEQGLSRIFGAIPGQPASDTATETTEEAFTGSPASTATDSSLLEEAAAAYEAALNAQRQGDWKRYGDEINKLGEIIKQLNQR